MIVWTPDLLTVAGTCVTHFREKEISQGLKEGFIVNPEGIKKFR